MAAKPFDILGLPARRDLDDEEVRAAWRRIAADLAGPQRGAGRTGLGWPGLPR